MILGIGTDIVSIARIERALERHGERFAERILATTEREAYRRSASPSHFLAKRFAAKEAAAKAFGTGFSDGLSLHDIAVRNDRRGRPELVLTGRASGLCEELGVGEHHVSLADEKDHAIAFVTFLERR